MEEGQVVLEVRVVLLDPDHLGDLDYQEDLVVLSAHRFRGNQQRHLVDPEFQVIQVDQVDHLDLSGH